MPPEPLIGRIRPLSGREGESDGEGLRASSEQKRFACCELLRLNASRPISFVLNVQADEESFLGIRPTRTRHSSERSYRALICVQIMNVDVRNIKQMSCCWLARRKRRDAADICLATQHAQLKQGGKEEIVHKLAEPSTARTMQLICLMCIILQNIHFSALYLIYQADDKLKLQLRGSSMALCRNFLFIAKTQSRLNRRARQNKKRDFRRLCYDVE